MPIVRSVSDMIDMFDKKTAPDRVGARYEAAKEIAIRRYTNVATVYRVLIEKIRGLLIANNVPTGKWGVHISFGELLQKYVLTMKGDVPATLIDGLKAVFVAKGADPAILDKIKALVI